MSAPGRYIVMLGFAGAGITLTLAELHREEVQQRFPKHFLKQEETLREVTERVSAFLTEVEHGLTPSVSDNSMVVLREHEVFPSLWKLADGLDAGLDIELGKIPVLQFVIEVCELFDVNPYVDMTALENRNCFRDVAADTETAYALLIATEEPEELLLSAEKNEIPAAVIGRLTGKNDRVVKNGEIIRYLTPEG